MVSGCFCAMFRTHIRRSPRMDPHSCPSQSDQKIEAVGLRSDWWGCLEWQLEGLGHSGPGPTCRRKERWHNSEPEGRCFDSTCWTRFSVIDRAMRPLSAKADVPFNKRGGSTAWTNYVALSAAKYGRLVAFA